MKKVLILVVLAMLLLFGCTNSNQNGNEISAKAFEQFEEGLTAEGFEFEKTEMLAELIGAVEGAKYTIDDWSVELYRYKKGSDTLKEVQKSNEVKLEGIGSFDVRVNGNMVLMDEYVNEEFKEKIQDIFNSLK